MLKKKPEVVPEPEEENDDEEPKEKDENAQETKEETKEETAKEDEGTIKIDNVTINNIEDLNDLKKVVIRLWNSQRVETREQDP